MKKKVSNILLVLIFLGGLSLMLYPTVSNYWNSFHQTQAITEYLESVEGMDNTVYEEMLESAREYNRNKRYRNHGIYRYPQDQLSPDRLSRHR